MIGNTLTEYWKSFHVALLNLYNQYTNESKKTDTDYLSIHNIAVKIAKTGQKIEDAPLFKKYKLGKQIDHLFQSLPLNKLPIINSPYTLHIANIFMMHSKYYASGQVYSKQFLINSHLYLHQNRAHEDVAELQKRISRYEETLKNPHVKTYNNDINNKKEPDQKTNLHYFEQVYDINYLSKTHNRVIAEQQASKEKIPRLRNNQL